MKRAVIVHAWGRKPNEIWYGWLKEKLEKAGFDAIIPLMPTDPPEMEPWVKKLQEVIPNPDEQTYFVGHSAGCITILRYLERLPEKTKVGGCVFVAGFADDLGYKELSNFFTTPIDWNKIKSHCKRFVAVHSDNDPWVPLNRGETLEETLRAELIVEHEKGHFSADDNCIELPVVLHAIQAWVQNTK